VTTPQENSLFDSAPLADHSLSEFFDSGVTSQGEVSVPFAEPQRAPKPPANPAAANMLIAAALREGDPNGDSLPRADGAPTRD
jgi:hypothetical protein